MEEKKGNWLQAARNPNGIALRKQFYELFKEKYSVQLDELLDRIGLALVTTRDMDDFLAFITEIYQMGAAASLASYEEQLKKLGYNVNISYPEKIETHKTSKIFKNCGCNEECNSDECSCMSKKKSQIFK